MSPSFPHTLTPSKSKILIVCILFLLWLGASMNITSHHTQTDRRPFTPLTWLLKRDHSPALISEYSAILSYSQRFKQHPIPMIPCPLNQINRQFDLHITQISSLYGPIGSAITIGWVIGPQSILKISPPSQLWCSQLHKRLRQTISAAARFRRSTTVVFTRLDAQTAAMTALGYALRP